MRISGYNLLYTLLPTGCKNGQHTSKADIFFLLRPKSRKTQLFFILNESTKMRSNPSLYSFVYIGCKKSIRTTNIQFFLPRSLSFYTDIARPNTHSLKRQFGFLYHHHLLPQSSHFLAKLAKI